jgi:transcriptional regulator with AAA-type ATPase domain/NAD-dependent dihydropyrimidine dehydrogenase PreA subunit
MTEAERLEWLRQQTPLASLPVDALSALAQALNSETRAAHSRLALEDSLPDSLYILRQGKLERYRTSPYGLAAAESLLPGSVLHWREILLGQPTHQTVVTLSDCELWSLPAAQLRQLAEEYPVFTQQISQALAQELEVMASQLRYEQDRQRELRPYLVPKLRRGIVGSSRYAQRLRQDIREAAERPGQPVLIFGEPGLNKDNIAALIHFGSSQRRESLLKINCETLQVSGHELFGRAGGRPGLLEWIGNGTLVLNNVHDLPMELQPAIAQLVAIQEYTPLPSVDEPNPQPRRSRAWILLVAERNLADLAGHATAIKVPPLRVRKADIVDQVNYYLNLYCRQRGIAKPYVTPEALRQLQRYDYPGNITELENILRRAIDQRGTTPELTEEVLWFAGNRGDRFRWNLLNAYPQFRQFLRSPWWPDRINYGFTLWFFAIVVALLLLGPQSRQHNVALSLFWAWWWPLMLIGFPFVGRLWCAVCPFMIYGELVQNLSLRLWPRELLPWPREAAERWGGWFLFGLFALILLWEELWNLENTAWLSGCLLLLITAGAVINALLFERRFWCRYLCPIGGMNGLFAKLAMVELRARRGVCSATCTTYQCYKGGPEFGEGQETGGCPVYSHPAQLTDNRNCVLCMTCLKACPHRSVELNLRPPGIELWTSHSPTASEVTLLFLLFGAVFLHRLPEGLERLGLSPSLLEPFGWHTLVAVGALALPGAIALLADLILRGVNRTAKPKPFIELAYGYLPLVLMASLAHYLLLGLSEAGQVLPVTFATWGVTAVGVPAWSAHPAVIEFLQAVALMVGFLGSVLLTRKIARQSFRYLIPQLLSLLLLTGFAWQVIV